MSMGRATSASRYPLSVMLLAIVLVSVPGGRLGASGLTSQFFAGNAAALQVMAGTPYSIRDPAWLDAAYDQNKSTFAYKVFSALFMLGYSTEMGYNYGLNDQQVRALHLFQSQNGLPISDMVDATCLAAIDTQIALRAQALVTVASQFPLYTQMKPLHPNDVSRDTVAYLYTLPMLALPASLQMDAYETLQCISGQCVGFIRDATGVNLSEPVDPTFTYFFVGAYFDTVDDPRKPKVTVDVGTVMHEYAHYLDGIIPWRKDPGESHIGLIDTTGFYSIAYDLSLHGKAGDTYPCYPRRSADPKDWITRYGYVSYTGCATGTASVLEDWADSFMMYVAAGRDFRAATLQSALVAQRYAWLKANVFQGIEYDTDLPAGIESGCNDVYGTSSAQPGYAHCNDNYIWNYALPTLPVVTGVTPDQASPVAVTGAAGVRWTATISGGAAVVEYQFWLQKDGGAATLARDWSPSPTYLWTPGLSDAGSWTITVNVRNAGVTASQSSLSSSAFVTTRLAPPVFTDDPLQPGITPLRVVHIVELRDRIGDLRQRWGLAAFGWAEFPLAGGETTAKASHFQELRNALIEVYQAANLSSPFASSTAPFVHDVIRAAHITELRTAIAAIW